MNVLERCKLRTDHLWPAIVLIGFLCFVSLVPLVPNDFWWHLKIGQLIFETGRIPDANLFSWSLPVDFPFFYGAWLGELLLYLVYWAGGLEAVLFTRTILVAITFLLIINLTFQRTNSWRLSALTVALAAGMTLNNLIVRPQIWSWVPFVIYLFVLNGFVRSLFGWRSLIVLPLIMIIWVNVHGAFILGGVMIGVFFVGEALQTMLHLPGALPWQKVRILFLVGLLTALAMLVNPRGLGIISYVVDLLTDKPSQGLIQEWQSPTPSGPANLVFYITIILLIVVLAYSRYKLTLTDLLLAISFLWLAWSGQRYVVWFGIVVAPILTQAFQKLPLPAFQLTGQRNLLNTIMIVILIIPLILVQPWFVERVPLPSGYWAQVHRGVTLGPLIANDTPIKAVEYLRTHLGGNLFNDMGYGSYLIWALPEQPVFIDPRVELYPFEQWEDYIRITRGTRYNQVLSVYKANRILLDKTRQSELALSLTEDPGWIKEFSDEHSEIWIQVK